MHPILSVYIAESRAEVPDMTAGYEFFQEEFEKIMPDILEPIYDEDNFSQYFPNVPVGNNVTMRSWDKHILPAKDTTIWETIPTPESTTRSEEFIKMHWVMEALDLNEYQMNQVLSNGQSNFDAQLSQKLAVLQKEAALRIFYQSRDKIEDGNEVQLGLRGMIDDADWFTDGGTPPATSGQEVSEDATNYVKTISAAMKGLRLAGFPSQKGDSFLVVESAGLHEAAQLALRGSESDYNAHALVKKNFAESGHNIEFIGTRLLHGDPDDSNFGTDETDSTGIMLVLPLRWCAGMILVQSDLEIRQEPKKFSKGIDLQVGISKKVWFRRKLAGLYFDNVYSYA